jgi:thiamine biosynthesis lipoprotein
MDADIYNLLVISDSLHKMTNGAFDPTIKPVYDLWGFGPSHLMLLILWQMPSRIAWSWLKTLEQVGFDKLRFDAKTLHKPVGVQLAFGAIAKGYILDKARST